MGTVANGNLAKKAEDSKLLNRTKKSCSGPIKNAIAVEVARCERTNAHANIPSDKLHLPYYTETLINCRIYWKSNLRVKCEEI